MKTEKLTTRWNNSDVKRIGAILLKGGRIDSVTLHDLPTSEGRLDLRGIQLSAKGFTSGVSLGASFASPSTIQNKIQLAHLDSVDLSHSNLSRRWIEDSTFSNALFVKSNLERVSVHSSRFVKCLFDQTNFDGAGIDYHNTRYEYCVFKKINFSKSSFACGEFDDCIFEECKFENVDFFGSSFERCIFSGKVHDVWFRGHYMSVPDKPEVFAGLVKQFGVARPNKMKAVDFSNADLSWVTFSDECDLSTCKIPIDDFVIKFAKWPQLLGAVEARIPYMFSADVEMVLQCVSAFNAHAACQPWYIVNFRDFSKDLSMSIIERLKELFVEEAKKIGAIDWEIGDRAP
jgi:uncharacterized protein YjbI with pentapeptide repeats